jgi:hypothetical protein
VRTAYPVSLITYQGHPFIGGSQTVSPDGVYLFVDDAEVAAKNGFEPTEPEARYRFKRWIAMDEVERWVHRHLYGMYRGGQVDIIIKDEQSFVICWSQGEPWDKPKGPTGWTAQVPREIMPLVWFEETEKDLSRFRR